MNPAVLAPLIPYALAVAGGIAIGAAGAGYVQQARIDALKVEAREQAVEARERAADARRQADEASAQIAGLSTDLAQAYRHQRTIHVETIREIERVASRDRQCLGSAAISVLRRADVRSAGAGDGAGEPAQAGPGSAPDPGRSASEAAIAGWMSAALTQYGGLRDQNRALAAAIRRLEAAGLVVVVPD